MAKKSKEELLQQIIEYIGEDTKDSALALLEDVQDSFAQPDVDWEKKYQENDKEWREKYKARFAGKQEPVNIIDPATNQNGDVDRPEDITIDDLFS